MRKLTLTILILLPLIGFGQAEKRYRFIIIDSVKALNGGRIDVKDTLLLDSLAVYNTDLSSQYTSRSLVDSAFVGTAISASGGNTIYSADDNLAGNRTVTQGANTLSFTADPVNAFSVDGTTFSVDASNNRVGIGTIAPISKFNVEGGRTNLEGIDATSGNDALLVEDNVGTDLMTVQNDGSVLIATSTPLFSGKLTINTAGVGITVKATDATANYLLCESSSDADIHNMFISGGVGLYTISGGPRFGGDFSVMPNLALGGSIAAEGGFTFENKGGTLIRIGLAVADNDTRDSPVLQLSGKYDSDPGAGITETDFDTKMEVLMTGAGASPTGRLAFTVEGIEAMSIDENSDVTINNILVEPTIPLTLGVAATTFIATGNKMKLTGDGGSNTIATITGGIDGMTLTLTFVDALITLTDDNTSTTNTINLPASFTSTANDIVILEFDGTSWRQASSSVN